MMKRGLIRTDRLWCLFLILAVFRVAGSCSKTINQVKLPIPTKETLPQVAEVLKAAAYLDDNDGLEKNFEGQRNSYKRSPRKLGTDALDKGLEQQEYQGVVGRPGVDFPILPSIPQTDFSCKKVKKPGYYADPETDCQVFHICDNGRKVSFLCPNGTVFRQSHLICDWWFRVDCERSIELYEESAEQLASDQRVFRERSEALTKAMLKVQTTQKADDRVVTERSFGPSTTIFNSESRLPERARYFDGFSRDENQVPAETASFVGNRYQNNFNNNFQSKTPVNNWNQGDFQPDSYRTQTSPTTAQPTWNQQHGANNNYQSNSYQAQSTGAPAQATWNQAANGNNYQSNYYQTQSTTAAAPAWNQAANGNGYQTQSTTAAQPFWNQVANNNYQSGSYQAQSSTIAPQPSNAQPGNNFQSDYRPQFTADGQYVQNQVVTGSQTTYQQQPTTAAASQTNWSQDSINYRPEGYQTSSTTVGAQTNWNGQSTNSFRTENNQYRSPTTAQTTVWNQSNNYRNPSTTDGTRTNWDGQGVNGFRTENYQTSSTVTPRPVAVGLDEQGQQKRVTTAVPQIDWNQAVNNVQTTGYQQPESVTTVQPDWGQEFSDTVQPSQQPTTVEYEQTTPPAKESQVLAESASFVGNSARFNFRPENYYAQTNPPQTSWPATSSPLANDYSPSGAFSFVEYQRSPDAPVAGNGPTQAPPVATAVFDYSNSTSPPSSGETLIPNMINSLQTLTDNNLIYDLDGQNGYPSQANNDDDLNSVAVYFNRLSTPQASTIASDLQFNDMEQTSRSYSNGVSSAGPVEATTPMESLHIPAVLTQNTKEAYDKLFKNDTNKEPTVTIASSNSGTTTTPRPNDSANVGFAQGLNLNRSPAELRELAAVFTRALTSYLDDPENFRKILAEVRPTEPPSVKTTVTEEQEVLDFSDDSKSHRSKPTEPSSTSPNLAAEINHMPHSINALADLSTTIPQYTSSPLIDITSKYTEIPNVAGLQEYSPPEDSEQLQVAGSQSFFSSRDNIVETAKTLKPAATSTLTWTVSPIIDTEPEVKGTTQSPVYFTTTAENLETTVIVQRAKEMFSHLNASDAGMLMNVMNTAQANDTVRRLVLLLVNDPNKENSPEQTRNNIIEALLDNRGSDKVYVTSSSTTTFLPSSTSGIPFGQRIQEDGSPVSDGQYKKPRKGTRRRVVNRSRSLPVSTTPMIPNTWQGANDVGPTLGTDSDARAVELLKSLYSIASKWS
ncbi:cell wall protein DAN4 [Sipha flava]|uniref:Cell wall protein DAN4 n=1 Tax=Sipha flava TaxID=143950 RepID=A0A8B8FVV0_9HEMI|nr:cell wall protein DAN4 [Sipha flava]XP_025414474.1 cell wall protein DAN4 [Sipha flava]XP_025414475.1 cell wall protein DAN4 [Sipha flava]